MRGDYSGYLSPYKTEIIKMHKGGSTFREIAAHLIKLGKTKPGTLGVYGNYGSDEDDLANNIRYLIKREVPKTPVRQSKVTCPHCGKKLVLSISKAGR